MKRFIRALTGHTAVDEAPGGRCLDCRHFRNDPAFIEQAFPGMTAMSSGHADVRANDGLCERHGVYLALTNGCEQFAPFSHVQPRPVDCVAEAAKAFVPTPRHSTKRLARSATQATG